MTWNPTENNDIPRATLTRHIKHQVSGDCTLGRYKPVFSVAMEDELSKHIIEMQERFYGLIPSDVRKLAFEFAEILHLEHPFDSGMKMAGEDWLGGFLKRHWRNWRSVSQNRQASEELLVSTSHKLTHFTTTCVH